MAEGEPHITPPRLGRDPHLQQRHLPEVELGERPRAILLETEACATRRREGECGRVELRVGVRPLEDAGKRVRREELALQPRALVG